MITSGAFSYINVLDKAADASWLREATITNNLANVDTPGFKRKDVDFEGVLKTELGRSKYVTLDQIPVNLQNAFIAIEDERFYSHHGVDFQGILRAFALGLANGYPFKIFYPLTARRLRPLRWEMNCVCYLLDRIS